MTQDQLEKMRGSVTRPKVEAKTVRVTCNDGDILEGFVEAVSDEERDVIVLVHSSNNPAKLQSGTHYSVKWDDIIDVQVLPEHW